MYYKPFEMSEDRTLITWLKARDSTIELTSHIYIFLEQGKKAGRYKNN